MYTRCPGCGSIFEIAADALEECAGDVECGVCNTRFDANQSVIEEGAEIINRAEQAVANSQPLESMPLPQTDDDQTPTLDAAVGLPIPVDESVFDELLDDMEAERGEVEIQGTLPLDVSPEQDLPLPPMEAAEVEVPDIPQSMASTPAVTIWLQPGSIAVIVLTMILLAQFVVAFHMQLGGNSSGNTEPQSVPPSPWEIMDRELRADPDRADALVLRAVIRNASDHPTPLPRLRLVVTDTAFQPIAQRTFLPSDYMQPGSAGKKLAANALLPVSLLITRPSRVWGGFQVQLLPPGG